MIAEAVQFFLAHIRWYLATINLTKAKGHDECPLLL
jgi:hypothetical protein